MTAGKHTEKIKVQILERGCFKEAHLRNLNCAVPAQVCTRQRVKVSKVKLMTSNGVAQVLTLQKCD